MSLFFYNAMPIKLPMVFFTELEQIASQFVWKYRKPGIAQSNLAKEEWNWRILFFIMANFPEID